LATRAVDSAEIVNEGRASRIVRKTRKTRRRRMGKRTIIEIKPDWDIKESTITIVVPLV
jgi:hypothetical protein